MRALAVTNPNATAMSPRTRDVIVRALGSELKIDVAETTRRGHAADLAAEARADSFDLVIAVGGDGTVNEVVDGLLRAGAPAEIPRLAVVPGGSANVFARALGLPSEPIEATGVVIERLRAGRERRVGLGLLETATFRRWFTFCAGFGLDAEIVREVERRRAAGARATPALYMRTGLRQFARTDRRHPALTIEPADDEPIGKLAMALVTNTTPWTYFGARALQPTPESSFEAGLDAFALRRLGAVSTATKLRRLLAGGTPRGRQVVSLHDVARLDVRASRPVAVQVDGDYLGECTAARLDAVPEALAVIS
jgi:diacylglycerol kinase family enzyme